MIVFQTAGIIQAVIKICSPAVECREQKAQLRRAHGVGAALVVKFLLVRNVPQRRFAGLYGADGAQNVGKDLAGIVQLRAVFCLEGHVVALVRQQNQIVVLRAITEDFISHLRSQNSKPETIVNYERTLKRITNHLHSVGVDSFRDMTPEHISSFLSTSIPDLVRNLRATLCHLRVFFRYLYLNEFTKDDLSLFIPKSNVLLKRKHIPSTWTREDIDKILACIDLASPVGKRDYAIILLVARLGIRVSDVIRLEFDNIKWEKNCIQISQYKTNEPLVLPLFEDVGQAIIDYVKNGRPASDLKLVFITHKPPFQKFSDNNHLYGMFNKYLYKAGIEVTPEKNHGMHTLRHSLANELLRKEIPLPVISEILGHKSLETTMQYLRADTEQLRCCTLVEGENYAVTT